MKKILIFSLAYYPSHISGAEVAIKEITDRIPREDIAFDMVTLRFDDKLPLVEMVGNVRVYRVALFGSSYVSKMLFPVLAAIGAYRLHREHHYDALWAMMTYMLFPTVIAKLLGVRVPHVLTLQDGDPYEKVFERWFIRPLAPLLDYGFRSAVVIQAISQYLAGWPLRRGYAGEVEVIPNGASLESKREYSARELDALRRSLGLKEGEIVLLTVGRLVHQKGQDTVIRALPLLPKNARYVLVGEGPDREMLTDLARELGVQARVTFVGHVDRVRTAQYRKVSDIFVSPSRSEGQGISFLSTMASGLPLIATQEGGLADFVFDAARNPQQSTTAWVVDKDSPEQIAKAVEDILAHPEKAREVAARARELVLRNYDWDFVVRELQSRVFARIPVRLA